MELSDQSFMRDPAPVLAKLRAEAPLVRHRLPIIGEVWITTTQAAASQILKDQQNFTVRKANGKVVGMQWWMPRSIKRLAGNMLSMDEPDHTRLRSMVDQAFHRREIMTLETRVDALAEEFTAELFSGPQAGELVGNFARRLPLAVICELLGLPREDWPQFTHWASGLTRVTGVWSMMRALHGLSPMTRYLEARIEQARTGEGSGLIRELVSVEADGNPLTNDELLAMVFLLLVAGHETTTHLISGSVLALLQNPVQKEKLLSDWSGIDLAVEEFLRFVSPVQFTKPRNVRVDCEIEGVSLSRGDVVMPMLIAANYDPAVFDNPDKLDIQRKPNRHMEFGTGIHFCLGHQLARLEMRAALKALFGRYPNLVLADQQVRWHERFGLRALERLQVAEAGQTSATHA